MSNCPNCGAPIVADQCEYCGTRFSDGGLYPTQTMPRDAYDSYEKMIQSGVVTANEARALLGLNPI